MIFGWLIDRLSDYNLMSIEKYFIYIQDEYKKTIQKWRKRWDNRVNDFWLPLKKNGELRKDEKFSLL